MSTRMVYGATITVTLESALSIGIWQVRLIAQSLSQMLLGKHGVVAGPLHHRCEPARWLELDEEKVYMPAMVLYYREGTDDE